MGILDSSNCRRMVTVDRLEIESSSIPEGKVTFGISTEQPASFWRPSYHVDRLPEFVERRVEVLGRDRINGSGLPGSRW
jgi:hypothetical protein